MEYAEIQNTLRVNLTGCKQVTLRELREYDFLGNWQNQDIYYLMKSIGWVKNSEIDGFVRSRKKGSERRKFRRTPKFKREGKWKWRIE